jgi:hypothetical protein
MKRTVNFYENLLGLKKTVGMVWLMVSLFLLSGSLVHAGWRNIQVPTVSEDWTLYGVHFPSSQEGWAVGADFFNKKSVLIDIF